MPEKRPTRQPRLKRNQGTILNINGVAYQTPYKRPKKAQAVVFPENISDKYSAKIQSFFQETIDNVNTIFNDFAKNKFDADTDKDTLKMLKSIEKEINQVDFTILQAEQLALPFADQIKKDNDRQYSASMQSAAGINVIFPEETFKPIISSWIKENSELIVTIEGDLKKKAQEIVNQYVSSGMSPAELTDQIEKLTNLPKWKAERIARTETNKFFSQLSETKTKELGINRYIWQSAGDSAVRDQHQKNNGKVFSYETGDENGSNPGSEINCRCIAIPYFQDLFSR